MVRPSTCLWKLAAPSDPAMYLLVLRPLLVKVRLILLLLQFEFRLAPQLLFPMPYVLNPKVLLLSIVMLALTVCRSTRPRKYLASYILFLSRAVVVPRWRRLHYRCWRRLFPRRLCRRLQQPRLPLRSVRSRPASTALLPWPRPMLWRRLRVGGGVLRDAAVLAR